jgi:predicted NBD/HSP70 family sugar kinase
MDGDKLVLGIDIGGTCVKVCLLGSDTHPNYALSERYTSPSKEELIGAVRDSISKLGNAEILSVVGTASVGICLPGKQSKNNDRVVHSLNLPCLNGWIFEEMIQSMLGSLPSQWKVVTDAYSAGFDYVNQYPIEGRTVAISLGTGVGMSLFDGLKLVDLTSGEIGHLGAVDVGRVGDQDRIGTDGRANTLESYIGVRALQHRRLEPHGTKDTHDRVIVLRASDLECEALARAIRFIHEAFTPNRVVLLGGVGMAISALVEELHSIINHGLTCDAKQGWVLAVGDSQYHAARGAAKIVSQISELS